MRTIFDIAGLPAVRGHDMVAHLVGQAEPYGPHYLLATGSSNSPMGPTSARSTRSAWTASTSSATTPAV
ncbi:hypothetical protein [Streptomyces fulvoviolaceus]|uniref:hypothetical protein n=1 Tax=Streptomyces fulvoviolaceus TaxID=285535 RepID=UPI0021C0713D|nr:hypothetical protein [Streptomyces fulvoviolaceus]MCT9080134.1 hypothetical protein [Streptomyces fulvoviolaceus]